MTLLNAFFYLMLIMAGVAVVMILHDLKKAEDRAWAAMNRLYGEAVHDRLHQNQYKNERSHIPFEASGTNSHERQIGRENRRDHFLTIEDWTGMNASTDVVQVNYDFSYAKKMNRKEQAVISLPSNADQSDCCA